MVDRVLFFIFAAAFALMAAGGYVSRVRRLPLWLGAVCAAGATAAAHYDAFWPMVVMGLLAATAAFCATDYIDLGWRVRMSLVSSVVTVGFLVLWPTLDTMSGGKVPCPRWIEDRVAPRLVAGLDLRGGLRLVYTVDVGEAVRDKRDHYYEDMRRELARAFELHTGDDRPTEEALEKLREKVEVAPDGANRILLTFKNAADVSRIDARFREQFRGEMGDPEIEGARAVYRLRDLAESSIRDRAVGQAKEIILRRVDSLGLREASVTTRGEDIIVEVPGEDEKAFATIRDIISRTARLEFKILDDDSDYFKELKDGAAPGSLPEGLDFGAESAPVGKDEAGERKVRTVVYAELRKKPEETIQQAHQRMKDWVATLTPPPDREVGIQIVRERDESTLQEKEVGFRTYLLRARAEVTGDMVRDAAAAPDQDQSSLGGWHVQLTFTDQGGRLFDKITDQNVKRRFAIVLDDRVESAPEILTRISGGVAQITMGSREPQVQLEDSRKLELVLRSGALPAPISPSNEQRIGPSLGKDSIKLGVQGAAGGGILVLIFMMLYYRRAGLIADVSVLLNVFLQLAVLTSFGAAMTLPGIAGIALTIGMGVDANVLINERIRDELRAGKSPRTAVEIGYGRALSAIIDGQLTTVIAGVVMAQYGTGPIKGFAITLMVGCAVAVFTGVTVSRVMFDMWVRSLGRTGKLEMG